MKEQVLTLGVLVSMLVLAAGKPAEDADTAQLLLRSCDHNADNALNAAEFAGCLIGTTMQKNSVMSRMEISRSEILRAFMDEADQNNDLRADETELQKFSARWFLADLFGGGELDFNGIIGKIVIILQYIGDEEYGDAITELYSLICSPELSSDAKISATLAIAAIAKKEATEAVSFIYAVIREVAGRDDAGGIFIVSASTVENIELLLQAITENDSTIISYIYQALVDIIVDLSFLNQASANFVAGFIQAVIENKLDKTYAAIIITMETNQNITSETAIALTELLEIVLSGKASDVTISIVAVLSAVLEDESAVEIAQILAAVIQAIRVGNSEAAINQLTLLYVSIVGSVSESGGFSLSTVVGFSVIIEALQVENGAEAIAAIQLLIRRSSSELSSSQMNTLELILTAIEDGDFSSAITLLVAVATSVESTVEISVDVFIALSSVTTIVVGSGDPDDAIAIIIQLLSDTSITISVEIREALRILITVLSEESRTESIRVISAIMTGSSTAFGLTISVEVASELQLVIYALGGNDIRAAIVIIEALLAGDDGGGSLSIVLRNELEVILTAIKNRQVSMVYAHLAVLLSESRSSSITVSATVSFLVVIEAISSGSLSVRLIVRQLQLLLQDEDLDASITAQISLFIQYVEGNQNSRAITAIVTALINSVTSIEKSTAAILYATLRLVSAGEFEAAIGSIEGLLEDISDAELRIIFMFVLQLLSQKNTLGVLIIINTIIGHTFGDDCFCA